MGKDTSNPPSSSSTPASESWGWTRRQRIGLGVLLAVLLVVLSVQFMRRSRTLDPPARRETGEPLLPQYMDPNTASAAELARVPHLGDALAGKIVAYREARRGMTSDGIVFRQASDLGQVPGIGAKFAAEFAPFFKFPEPAAATATRP